MKRVACASLAAVLLVGVPFTSVATAQVRRVNAPYFQQSVRPSEAAVFWFGHIDALQNYADVRVAYTDQEVWIKVTVFDQWLWQDNAQTRTPASLETWDAASLFLDTAGGAASPSSTSFRLVGELSWWRPRTDYQAAYVGNGSGWNQSPSLGFTTETGWRGDAPNNNNPDRGWVITFRVPFASLGVSGPPAAGAIWRLAVQLHDRDSQASAAVSNQFWPEAFQRDRPDTWGQLAFGLRPTLTLPPTPTAQTYTIRQGLDGATVQDAMVGGSSTCGTGLDFFNEWGAANYAGSTTLVVQNQADVADWPCFSKFYVDFPLSALPPGRSVLSATLTIYQFGGSDPSQALPSLVQVSTVNEDWDENAINWNTAPLAQENVAQSWVDVIPSGPVTWPGSARTWNLSWALARAYAAGESVLRLALYEADGAYHSGKYFSSSDTGDWNAVGRPTLQVVLGDPATPPAPPQNLRVIRQ